MLLKSFVEISPNSHFIAGIGALAKIRRVVISKKRVWKCGRQSSGQVGEYEKSKLQLTLWSGNTATNFVKMLPPRTEILRKCFSPNCIFLLRKNTSWTGVSIDLKFGTPIREIFHHWWNFENGGCVYRVSLHGKEEAKFVEKKNSLISLRYTRIEYSLYFRTGSRFRRYGNVYNSTIYIPLLNFGQLRSHRCIDQYISPERNHSRCHSSCKYQIHNLVFNLYFLFLQINIHSSQPICILSLFFFF